MGIEGAIEMSRFALRVAFWSLVLLVAARLGARLAGSRLRGVAHLVWDGAAGLPLLVAAWLVVGLVRGGFARGPILAVLGLAVAGALLARRGERLSPEARGAPTAAAAAIAGLIALAGLAWDRIPPLFYDSLAYHFAQPDLWLLEGRIAPEAWSLHSWFPPGMSVLFGVGLALGGEPLANDANLLAGLLLLGMAFDLGRRRAGEAGGLAALALLASFPIVLHALAVPAADLGHGLFGAGALGALAVRDGDDEASWRRRAGWLAAGAALTKYLGLLVPLGLGGLWLLIGRDAGERGAPFARRAGRALAFGLPSALLLAPWLLANARATGNPVAPVASGLARPAGLAEGGAAAFRLDARGGLPGSEEIGSLVPRLFGGEGSESPFYPAPAWGLMPIVLLLALPLARRADRAVDLLALAGIAVAIWLVTYRWERFLVAATFLMAVAIGGLLASAWRRGGVHRLAPLLALLLGLGAVTGALVRVAGFTGGLPVVLGREAPRALFERSFPAVRIVRSARLDAPQTRLLLVGDMRHYGLGVARVAPTGFNEHPLVDVLEATSSPDEARAELTRRGFTHLLIDPGWIERSGRRYPSLAPLVADPSRLLALVRALGPPVAAESGVALYRLSR